MHRQTTALGFACLLTALLLTGGCGPSEDELAAQAEQARQEELATLRQQHQDLQAKRAERAELQARLAAGEEEEAADDEAAETATPEELQAKIDQLTREIDSESEEFYSSLVSFINAEGIGETLSETQLAAIHMKSDEDMLVAQEYIVKGGDYQRAIRIYEDILAVDSDNERVQAALASAQELRYMTQERFSQVKRGMTQDEVRELLGQPNIYNVREYEDQREQQRAEIKQIEKQIEVLRAWFYPKDETRAAAGVWFRGEEPKVYQIKFDAIEGVGSEEEEEGG